VTPGIKTLIVDDHAVVRDGIRRALELRTGFEISGAASIAEARAISSSINPRLFFIDLNLTDGNGLELVSWIRDISREAAIVVLSMHDEDEFILAAMRSGASAYVNKSEPLPVLLSFVDHALRAPTSFSADGLTHVLNRDRETFGLSPRELHIVSLLHEGESLKVLAGRLFIAESTLKKHLTSIYRKLGVGNQIQAVAKVRRSGLLK
jgi:DNA-binding NarL/FixJ family response regulator